MKGGQSVDEEPDAFQQLGEANLELFSAIASAQTSLLTRRVASTVRRISPRCRIRDLITRRVSC